jgi:hypothetical protein
MDINALFANRPGANGSNGDATKTNEFFHAVAGVSLMAAGASLIMAHPEMRQYLRDAVRAAFPDLNIDQEFETIKRIALQEPLTLVLSTILPDMERYMSMRAM